MCDQSDGSLRLVCSFDPDLMSLVSRTNESNPMSEGLKVTLGAL